jgi:hypothetical protein
MHGEVIAVCALTDDAAWRRFVKTVQRHGRGRIRANAHLLADGRLSPLVFLHPRRMKISRGLCWAMAILT